MTAVFLPLDPNGAIFIFSLVILKPGGSSNNANAEKCVPLVSTSKIPGKHPFLIGKFSSRLPSQARAASGPSQVVCARGERPSHNNFMHTRTGRYGKHFDVGPV